MTFVTASLAIAGLAATAVPILIHLLWRRRRTPIEWAAMRFLIEAYRRHRRRLRLEQMLLLLVRCLIPALLGVALARPLLDRAPLLAAGLSRTVYLIIDEGMASGLTIEGAATALDEHVGEAKRIIRGLNAGDRAGVITAARPASILLSPPTADHRAIIELLDSLEPQASRTDLAGALDHLRQALSHRQDQEEQVLVYLLSDLRAGSADLDESLPSLAGDRVAGLAVDLLARPPAANAVSNTQITGIEPARSVLLADVPEESGRVTVHLARRGGDLEQGVSRIRLSVDASVDGEQKIIEWAAGQVEASVEFLLGELGRVRGETTITASIDDDPLAADNQYHLILPIRRRFEIVLVDRREFGYEPSLDRLTAGQWIRRALEPGATGPLTIIDAEPASLSAADVQTADAVALPRPDLVTDAGWTTLRRFVDDGGLLLITPPHEEILHGWVDHLRSDLALPWPLRREVRQHTEGLTLAEDSPRVELLRRISANLPELMQPVLVYQLLPMGGDVEGAVRWETALRLSDGSPLILVGSPEAERAAGEVRASRGLVVLFTTAPELDWTNLPTKPLMVPLFQEIVRQGLSLIRSRGPTRVGDITAAVAASVEPAAETLMSPGGTSISIQRSGQLARALPEAGLYRVADGAGRELGRLAVNVDPAGGDLTPQPAGAVKTWLDQSGPWRWLDPDDIGGELAGPGGRSSPAGLLLLLLLAMVVMETVMARSFSRGSKASRGPEADGLRPTMDERSSVTTAGEAP